MAFSRIKFTIFFVLLPGPFCSAVLWQDLFVFLLRISCHSNVCEKFDLCCTDFRKAIACLCVTHTAQISTGFVAFVKIYLGKRHWRKKLYFSSYITKDLQYYIFPRYAWNAVFLWIRSPREIYSIIRTVRTKGQQN